MATILASGTNGTQAIIKTAAPVAIIISGQLSGASGAPGTPGAPGLPGAPGIPGAAGAPGVAGPTVLVDSNGVSWSVTVDTDGSLRTTSVTPGNVYGVNYGVAVYA